MKSIISHSMNAVILSLMLSSCTSVYSANLSSVPLSNRTLRINPANYKEFIYCGQVCSKYVVGVCWGKWKQVCDTYPFDNVEIMKSLSDAEMVLGQREKP